MISIIVPIYNAERYLADCIESLLHQTEKDVEVLLIDDESTDSSLSIAQAYAQNDSRVHVLQQAHAGQSAARNLGLTKAQGEYIAFVDADDTIEPDWCARHLAAIDGVDYVQSGYKRIEPSSKDSASSIIRCEKIPRHRYQFTSPCMRLYRKQVLVNMHFTPGMIYEDVIWSVDLWQRDTRCRTIAYTGYCYTLNPFSTTATRHPEAQVFLLNSLRERMQHADFKRKIIILYTLMRLKLHFLCE